MARLLQVVAIVVGLLWSNVCVTQCSLVPHTSAGHAKLPPCHQKKCPEQPAQKCSDPGIAIVIEKQFAVDAFVAVAELARAVFLQPAALPMLIEASQREDRPPMPPLVLRV